MARMKIIANAYFARVENISHEYLAKYHILGIALDIDNTIVADGETEIAPSVSQWLKTIALPVCLLSNGKEQRVRLFADLFGLSYICRANKPFKKAYVKTAELLDIKDMSKIVVIGDQLFSDILGGNWAGCHTVKVSPIDKTKDPFAVKIKRWFEKFVT